MKSTRLNDSAITARHENDNWEHGQIKSHERSYEILSDAFITIFENVYLLAAALSTINKNAPIAHFASLKSRYAIISKIEEQTGHLEIEIGPANISGVAQSYMDAPPEIRNALMSFNEDLMEQAAGIPGVTIDRRRLAAAVKGPQPFLEMIKAICAAHGIKSFESIHDARIAKDDECEERVKNPGYCNYLPPESVNAGQPHDDQKIICLLNDFSKNASYPLLSLQALETAVKQDLAGPAVLSLH